MSRPEHVVVVGSVNVDLVVRAGRLPRPGETVGDGTFLQAHGGKGANQAVAAARLGAAVGLVARVGTDSFGDEALAHFRAEGIRTDHVTRDPAHATGVAVITVDAAGQNAIAVAPGANAALTPADVDRAADSIRSAGVLVAQLETPLETVRHAVRLAAEAGVPVVLNPAPAPDRPLPADLLRAVAVLTPNETEATALSGVPVGDEASARRAALTLLESGVRTVVVTLGGRGVLIADATGVEAVPAARVRAVDTTAAGDAFTGALARFLAAGLDVRAAARRACAAAALSVTRFGAQPSLPTAAELSAFEGARHSR
ncbi:ribokinase [Urbifossiella limnaea]|uniref:Ribokinase n=1 Tax=Urbifossiella limnaea TaxID=2528023 RepID=A0A517Y292_9BACT|nr:ribokinase [Urbifossiella limnaea]QDU23893.1 Ribokinase [Urbifossiella limnaea]